jgi:hypothetical protein
MRFIYLIMTKYDKLLQKKILLRMVENFLETFPFMTKMYYKSFPDIAQIWKKFSKSAIVCETVQNHWKIVKKRVRNVSFYQNEHFPQKVF